MKPADSAALSALRFDDRGLAPAIVRDVQTREVLMLAWMNAESLQRTLQSGQTWFWSRSRQELWHKGATSGNFQSVRRIALDCDSDTLLIDVEPQGPACHNGTASCFENVVMDAGVEADVATALQRLEATLLQRRRDRPEGSYSAYLFNKGTDKILKKIGEEATEVVIAAKGEGKERLVSEVADLMFHLTALLVNEEIALADVFRELDDRAQPVEESHDA